MNLLPPTFINESGGSRWSPRRLTRKWITDEADALELHLVEEGGVWYEETSGGSPLPIAGARPMVVRELVAGRFKETQRYGSWIEIRSETARSHSDLLTWCRRHCNSELPSGGFRFAPKVWEEHSDECLSVPFLPEFDHPSPAIRKLAAAERYRRRAEDDLRFTREWRDELVKAASEEGHSRRQLGSLLGLSFGRIQQLVHAEEAE